MEDLELSDEDVASFDAIFSRGFRKKHCKVNNPEIPPYPDSCVVNVAAVPPPPFLNPSVNINDNIKYVANTYMKAIDAFYLRRTLIKCSCFVGVISQINKARKSEKAQQKLERMNHYKLLKKATELFIEHEISPASWIAFSIESYIEYDDQVGRDAPPYPSQILYPKRFDKSIRGWIRREGLSMYKGGKLIYSPYHKELVQRWNAMDRSLRLLGEGATAASVYDIIDEFFPGDLYHDLISKCNKHAKETQDILKQSVERGEWLWSDSIWQ